MTGDDLPDEAGSYDEPHDSPVTAAFTAPDGDIETSLRPKSLDDFIGQPRVREQLQLVLRGATHARRHTRPHPAVRSSRAGQDVAWR